MENKLAVLVLVSVLLALTVALGFRGDYWRVRYCTEALSHAATGADSVVIYQDVPKCLKAGD